MSHSLQTHIRALISDVQVVPLPPESSVPSVGLTPRSVASDGGKDHVHEHEPLAENAENAADADVAAVGNTTQLVEGHGHGGDGKHEVLGAHGGHHMSPASMCIRIWLCLAGIFMFCVLTGSSQSWIAKPAHYPSTHWSYQGEISQNKEPLSGTIMSADDPSASLSDTVHQRLWLRRSLTVTASVVCHQVRWALTTGG